MTPGASRGSMASFSFSDLDDDEIGDREEYMRSKSGRHQRSSRYRRSLSRKSSESALPLSLFLSTPLSVSLANWGSLAQHIYLRTAATTTKADGKRDLAYFCEL